MICRLIHTKLWYPFRYINCTYYFEFDFHFNRFQLQDFKPTLFLTIITKSEVRFREAPCSACNYNDDTALVTLHKIHKMTKVIFIVKLNIHSLTFSCSLVDICS